MISGLHIELTNICTLKCPGCARTRFINQWPQHWKNHSLNIEQTMQFLDVDLDHRVINLCGVYGDPIYHPEFIEFVKRFKQRGAVLKITTNGSYKNQSWWQQLVECLTDQDIMIFSVDGVPENFTQYRVNADWASIQVGIETAVKSQAKTQWTYIPFAYNQTQIDSAQKLSQDLGMDVFFVSPSDRFDQDTDHLKPDQDLLGSRYPAQTQWKNGGTTQVNPKCQDDRHHYISATGHYSPCCFAADHRFYYKTPFGKNKKEYNISTTTLSQILKQPAVVEFYRTLDHHSVCQFNCPG
jgi:MoaA/NifB/PqqE/SkfB family radical SAM enzyme